MIKFKHLNMPEDKPKLNQYLKRLILEYGLKEPIYIQSTLKVSDGYNRLMCLKDIITNIDDVKIPCIMTSFTTTTDIKKRQEELYKMDWIEKIEKLKNLISKNFVFLLFLLKIPSLTFCQELKKLLEI